MATNALVGIGPHDCNASITIANGVRGGFRTKLRELGLEGFGRVIADVERRMRPLLRRSPGSEVFVYAVQRHYRSQRSMAHEDAKLTADLRCLVPGIRGRVKHQPGWLDALHIRASDNEIVAIADPVSFAGQFGQSVKLH
jgi:hypothetical protein